MTRIFATPLQGRFGEAIRRFAQDNSGATAVEYAVLTFIAIAIVAAISQLGGSVTSLYEQVQAVFD